MLEEFDSGSQETRFDVGMESRAYLMLDLRKYEPLLSVE